MPGRFELLLNNNIYHVFNKTINSQLIFNGDNYCKQFVQITKYYRSVKTPVSFSHLKNLEIQSQASIWRKILLKKFYRVEILAFSLMPTHFHFLLRQAKTGGISKFMANTLNSFTRYFNIKNQKIGPLLLPRFKSVKINTDEQLIHVSRYIHLNPYSSGLVSNLEDLKNYSWSSYRQYVEKTDSKYDMCNLKPVLRLFGNDKTRYRNFVLNHADYQKSLEKIKYLRKIQ